MDRTRTIATRRYCQPLLLPLMEAATHPATALDDGDVLTYAVTLPNPLEVAIGPRTVRLRNGLVSEYASAAGRGRSVLRVTASLDRSSPDAGILALAAWGLGPDGAVLWKTRLGPRERGPASCLAGQVPVARHTLRTTERVGVRVLVRPGFHTPPPTAEPAVVSGRLRFDPAA